MVEVTKEYVFHGPEGEARLLDRSRAAARPRWRTSRARPGEDRALQGEEGLDVPLVLVARQRLQLRLPRHARRVGCALEYNYRPFPAEADWEQPMEMPGTSYFLRDGDRVFHTYSTSARGAEQTGGSYYWLDLTALGRQEEWEEPKGRAEAAHAAGPDFRGLIARHGGAARAIARPGSAGGSRRRRGPVRARSPRRGSRR